MARDIKQQIIDHFNGDYGSFFGKYLSDLKQYNTDESKALCCFHKEKSPSLFVNVKKGTFNCFGCGTKGDFFTFYGLKHGLNGDFPAILKGMAADFGIENGSRSKNRKLAVTYDYRDEKGSLLYQTLKYKPKDFRQRRPDGKDGWIWNLKGVRLVLYNLRGVSKTDLVCIAEGEKDADTLNKYGFIGTTNPLGAGKWRNEFNQYFKDKDVVIFPHNDKPGREHAGKIAIALKGIAASIKIIELPGLKEKEDVTDFINKISDTEDVKERLAIIIEQSEPYKPPKTYTHEDAILEDNEFQKLKLPEKEKLLDPWLTLNMIALMVGWRGVGKTWFAMGLLDAVTRGIAFGPWETVKSVPCLYHEAEMPAQDVQDRFKSLNPDSGRVNPLYIYSDAYANLLGLTRSNLLDETWRNTVKQILITKDIKLWVLDNLASTTPGIDENAKKDWDPINEWLLELRFHGISTILLHHTNKAGQQRGTSAREDNIDISIMLKQPHNYLPEEGARFLVKFEKSRVPTADLPQIADTQFHLSQDERGHLVWTFGNFKKETSKEVLVQLDEGMKSNEVADILGISKGRVSQIRKWGINNNYLTEKNKLTQDGFIWAD